MNTSKWGPCIWKILHTLPWLHPPNISLEQRKRIAHFHALLYDVLPCIYCRRSYRYFYYEYPIWGELDHRITWAHWMFTLHNLVNNKLDKPVERDFRIAIDHCALNETEFADAMWDFMFIIALNFPENPKEMADKVDSYRLFFNLMPEMLPNTALQQQLRECVERNPPKSRVFQSRRSLAEWIYTMRQNCSGRHSGEIITLDEMLQIYEKCRA